MDYIIIFYRKFSTFKTYQQPVENFVITLEINIETLFGDLKTVFLYQLF